jgi:hypothetical protein
MATKTSSAMPREGDSSNPKPLASSLLQEFQNLKDKFKNEDENAEKGLLYAFCRFQIDVIGFRLP